MSQYSGGWSLPGKDCGLCNCSTCDEFEKLVVSGDKDLDECPFYSQDKSGGEIETEAEIPDKDIFGEDFDFVLTPLPQEISARKIVLPFKPEIIHEKEITRGDIVSGRPMGAGCPIPHILKVIEADPVTGLLFTWVVGPKYSREGEVKDVKAYHMIGFEGIASVTNTEPQFGKRQRFLPGFCMMSLSHTGVINMVLQKECGLQVRIEDIVII